MTKALAESLGGEAAVTGKAEHPRPPVRAQGGVRNERSGRESTIGADKFIERQHFKVGFVGDGFDGEKRNTGFGGDFSNGGGFHIHGEGVMAAGGFFFLFSS